MSRARLVTPVAHIPGVFSHYGPSTGSALVTKVYEHARALERAGGTAYVLVNEAREVAYEAGTVVRFASPRAGRREYLTAPERGVDRAAGLMSGRRPLQQRYWRPAVDAVPADAGAVVVYNQPNALPGGRRRPERMVRVLHLGNDVFRGWRPRHVARALAAHDLTVAVSGFTAEAVNRRLPRGAPRVQVLRNGVDVQTFRPGHPAPDLGPPEILFVGNMVRHKGAHHLLQAANLLRGRGLEFVVRIVGSWGLGAWDELTPYEQELRAVAAPLGAQAVFQSFTRRDEIAEVYRRAAIFCMPVEWDEPAGQVVTEAMATGLPVVAAARGGIPEYLGTGGVYVDPEDTPALADALEAFLVDRARRQAVGAALRRRACTMTWDVRVRQLDRLLRGERSDD